MAILEDYRAGILHFNNLEILNKGSIQLRKEKFVKSIRVNRDLFGNYKYSLKSDADFSDLKVFIEEQLINEL